MSLYIPNKRQGSFLSQRQMKRKQNHQINKIEKKFGKHINLPTDEEIKQYIESQPKKIPEWLIVNQEEKVQ